jgi:hypothetical protein
MAVKAFLQLQNQEARRPSEGAERRRRRLNLVQEVDFFARLRLLRSMVLDFSARLRLS